MSYPYGGHHAAAPPPPQHATAADAPSSAAAASAPPTAVCLVRRESQHMFDLDKISALGIRTRVAASSAPDLIFIKDGQRLSFLVLTSPPPPPPLSSSTTTAAQALPPALLERLAACARTSPSPPFLLLPLSWASSRAFARLCADRALRACARPCATVADASSAAGVTDAALRLADELFCCAFEDRAAAANGGGGGNGGGNGSGGGGSAAAARAEAASPGAAGDVLMAMAAAAMASAAGLSGRGDEQQRQQRDLAERLARVMQRTPGGSLASLARALAGANERGGQGLGVVGGPPVSLLSRQEASALRALLAPPRPPRAL